MNIMYNELEMQRKNIISKIEEKKNSHVNEIIDHHKDKFQQIKQFYSDIIANNLDNIKTYKEKVKELQVNENTELQKLLEIKRQFEKQRRP
jgi:phage shock protein A